MKDKICYLNLFYFFLIINYTICNAQTGDWVWIKGTTNVNDAGNYGTQGITSPLNNPPGLGAAFKWKDLNGNFWLFGGYNTFMNVYADLWKYELSTNQWTWIKGTHQSYWAGIYGTQGVSAPNNNPSSRYRGATWTDIQGNLWLFGGVQSAGNYYSDLWKYNISLNQWTWVKGPNTPLQSGIYGTQGIPNILNNPSARSSCNAAWTDNQDNLWLFGGNGVQGLLNDLWRYNISTNEWTWMKGDSTGNQQSFFGTIGVEDSLNVPSGRSENTCWKDIYDNFWIFGGIVSNGGVGTTNQLWRFNHVSNNWTWMNGDSIQNSNGSNGNVCITSISNQPPARWGGTASWLDDFGNLFFYGGINNFGFYSDLWKYCYSNGELTLQKPINAVNWGTIGVSNPSNTPGYRISSVSWKDNVGNFYLFGGYSPLNQTYNDLWRFTIDSTCGSCIPTVGLNEINYQGEQILIYPNPATDKVTIKYFNFFKKGKVKICNVFGKSIFDETILNKTKTEINVKNISAGIYFVKVFDGEKSYCKKLIVE